MDLNHLVCDFDQSDESRIPKDSGYVNLGDYSPSITNMVGVAINGVPMFNGNGPSNTDFFYPQSWEGSISSNAVNVGLDACLGYIDDDNIYHYWFLPPCVFDTTGL